MPFILVLSGCNITKHVPEGDALYTGENIRIVSDDPIPRKNRLMEELEDVSGPSPNFTVMGLMPQLWFYNLFGGPDARGLWRWLQSNLGEPPVLLSTVRPNRIQELMENRLFNNGHFDPEVDYNIHRRNRRAEIEYIARINAPFRINEVYFPEGDTQVEADIRATKDETLLRTGSIYNLGTLTEERERIDQELEDKGYYYFTPDAIIFRVDSTIGNRLLNIYVSVKPDIPPRTTEIYRFRNVYINTNYNLRSPGANVRDTLLINRYFYLDAGRDFRPMPILRSVFLRPDSLYSRTLHTTTLSRLMGLGVFSFANVRYEEVSPGRLDAHITMSPLSKKSVRAELQGVSKSNSFIGPSVMLSFINRNAFGGAELLQLNITGGYETQIIRGQQTGLTSFELGAEGHLEVPRFMNPLGFQPTGRFVPKTHFRLGIQHLNRTQFFAMNSFNASTGYTWRESTTTDHRLNLININYLLLSNQTPEFEQILDQYNFLRRSFEQQFILGSNYTYTYNSQLRPEDPRHTRRRRSDFFFMGNVDVSGNTMRLLHNIFEGQPRPEPDSIFGSPYSQYSRIDTDVRYYYRPGIQRTIAMRFMAGIGIPYGNSETMPYVKQFFMGGPNSIRAFRARSVGPGTYQSPTRDFLFFDQVGDIRLEANFEYRFPIISIVKGAYFIDAGNIWLLSPEGRPEGVFRANQFLEQIAVGTGFGLRFDVTFFVLRFDLGIPLKKPYRDVWEFQNGVADNGEDYPGFLSREWRREGNLILNIGIGYPF